MTRPKNREREIVLWLLRGDIGISSECMAYTALGLWRHLDWSDRWPPSDPADLGRCLRLLKRLPWVRKEAFPKLRRQKRWSRLIKNWDALAAQMEAEVGIHWEKGSTAPLTYEAMQRIGL